MADLKRALAGRRWPYVAALLLVGWAAALATAMARLETPGVAEFTARNLGPPAVVAGTLAGAWMVRRERRRLNRAKWFAGTLLLAIVAVALAAPVVELVNAYAGARRPERVGMIVMQVTPNAGNAAFDDVRMKEAAGTQWTFHTVPRGTYRTGQVVERRMLRGSLGLLFVPAR